MQATTSKEYKPKNVINKYSCITESSLRYFVAIAWRFHWGEPGDSSVGDEEPLGNQPLLYGVSFYTRKAQVLFPQQLQLV